MNETMHRYAPCSDETASNQISASRLDHRATSVFSVVAGDIDKSYFLLLSTVAMTLSEFSLGSETEDPMSGLRVDPPAKMAPANTGLKSPSLRVRGSKILGPAKACTPP